MNPIHASTKIEASLPRVAEMATSGARAHVAAPVGVNATGVAGKSAAEATKLQQPAPTSEQKTAGKLRSVKSGFMMPAQLEFFGMLGGGALGWVAKRFGWERAQGGIAIAAHAPVKALRQTNLADVMQLPANLFKAASSEASTVGGAAAKWTEGLNDRAVGLLDKAKSGEKIVADKTHPLANSVGKKLDSFGETGFGQTVREKLHGFMQKRQVSAQTKHTTALANAHGAVTSETTGMWKSTKNFFKSAKPGEVDVKPLQEAVVDGIKASETMAGVDRTKHLTKLVETFDTQMRSGSLSGEVKARADNVMKHLQSALTSSKKLENYVATEAGAKIPALGEMVGKLAKSAGRIPLYNALLTVGIAAGIGAVLVTARGESKEAKAAFAKLNTQLADHPNSSFLKSVKAAQKTGKKWGLAKTGLHVAGEVTEGFMWMLPNGGGAGMMGAMMVPQLCEMLVPGNAMLGALEALDKSDKGQLQLRQADRIQIFAQLIGSIESVAKNGGQYNRLAKAVAGEMQERGFKYPDVVKLLGDDVAFGKFANEVSAKQKAETAKTAAEVKAVAPVVEKIPAIAARAPMLAAAPSNRIGVGATEAHHKGMVVDNRQLAMA